MTGIDPTTTFVAAVVSGAVALGVEWMAKPRLEARKERILRRYRAQDEVKRCLLDILIASGTLKASNNRQPSDGDANAALKLILHAAQSIEENYRRELMLESRIEITGLMADYVGCIHGLAQSDRSAEEKGRVLSTVTPMIIDVLGGRSSGVKYWVRWRYRARQLGTAMELMESGELAT